MTDGASPDFAALVHTLAPGSHLLRVWRLEGGVSADVSALTYRTADGGEQRIVVRRYGAGDVMREPHIAAHEFNLLRRVRAAGVPAPEPLAYSHGDAIIAQPYIVLSFIEGQPEFAPAAIREFAAQAAAQLAAIHRIDAAHPAFAALPCQHDVVAAALAVRPAIMDESLSERRVREALTPALPFPGRNPSVLLHGDYWQGNWLWRGGKLTGILDWEDAATGDPMADVANCRLELMWQLGETAMTHFTEAYRTLTDFDFATLPHWELWAALRPASRLSGWGLESAVEQKMRAAHARFVGRAIERLRAQS